MIKYAITGNIASGKSAVENILIKNGETVIDTDKISHELLEGNNEIIETFKDFDILSDGKISREKLGKIVFSDKSLKKKLENILHPQIIEKINEFFEQNQDKERVFVSIPLLFETKTEGMFDKIIFIYCDDKIRLNRLMERENYTREYAKNRMKSQQNQDGKVKYSDIVIYNDSTPEELERLVKKLIL
jgi:dephospho-CoA kinase